MNVTEKFRHAIAEGEPLDWDILKVELDAEHALAGSTRERVNLLALLTVMADMVERIDTSPDTVADFRNERRQIHHHLLLREASLAGVLCAKALNDVTAREVTMGRMAQDDPLRLSAIVGLARMTDGLDLDSNGQLDGSAPLAAVAEASAGPWHRWIARTASMIRRSSAVWRGNPHNRAV